MRSRVLFLALVACALLLSAAGAEAATFTVNITADLPDADPADGICAAADGKCTLRAAIMQANFTSIPDTITVPSGLYMLTRAGYDDGALIGDLDIKYPLTIQGAGSGLTIVDGNGAVTGDRVFQVLDSAVDVTLNGMTIRNGNVPTTGVGGPSTGGGILVNNVNSFLTLHLNDVTLEGNTALIGGGLFASASKVDLKNSTVRANAADPAGGNGGGMCVAFGSTLTIQDSQVYSNSAYGGGGLALEGILTRASNARNFIRTRRSIMAAASTTLRRSITHLAR
jgi:CSLREA domain-containing protein